MKTLVVFTHPNPKSFNAAILQVVQEELATKSAEVKVKDLYAINFNPTLAAQDFVNLQSGKPSPDVATEQEDVAWADTLIFIYPIWWHERPAMLKGWIDRVFSYGFAYQYGEQGFEGLLKGKRALVFTTSGADEKTALETGQAEAIKSMLYGTLSACGIEVLNHINFYAVPTVSDEDRKAMLEKVRNMIKGI